MDDKTREKLLKMTVGASVLELRLRNGVRGALPSRHHTPLQVACLETLSSASEMGLSMGEIALTVGVSAASMSGLTRRMKGLGLITVGASREDRRRMMIRPTRAGLALVERANKARQTLFDGLVDSLGARKTDRLASLLGQFVGDRPWQHAGFGRRTRSPTRRG